MVKKILSIFILGMFLFSLGSVYAIENFGGENGFKQFDNVRLAQICDDATYITISSITYPNSSTAISNVNMTSSGSGEFYYNFNLTSNLGRYEVRGISDGCEGTFIYYFNVTPSGFNFSIGLYVVFFLLSLGIVLLGFYIQDNWVIVLGGFAVVVVGLFQLFFGVVNFKDTIYTWALGIIVLMLGSYFSIRGAWEALS